jgi:ankyrin repeat protein
MLHADPRLLTTKSVLDPAGRKREPLAHALIYGHKEIATFLLAQGADINAQSDDGLSMLHLALGAQQNELARWLVAQGAAVDIWAAALLGDLPLVQAFVEADPSLVHARWVVGATLLHIAATVPLAQYLLTQGADSQMRTGQMALTPLGWHASVNHHELVQFYVDQGYKAENIFIACAIGDLAQVQAFLTDEPALLYARDPERNHSLLHFAALGGHCAVAQFLLEQGIDVNDGVAEGVLTPLPVAIQCNQVEMVQFLIQAGADLTLKDPYHQLTARQWAERYGNETIIYLV